ncbi:MAG: hypothetical protein KF729_20665 [Sandaracinaceae bacterium]|nr:hypothetical protein [Sandaracinaceae bacterium]
MRGAAALVLVSVLGACGGGARDEGPARAVAAYAAALQRGDGASAWDSLDEEARHGRSRGAHDALMATNAAELREQGEALARAGEGVAAHARLELASGESVLLVLEPGGWRVAGGVLDATGLATPLDAVAAFRRALSRRDLSGVERVLARQTRAEWEAELRRLLDATADADDLEVEVQGDRARVRTSGGGSIELVRESGEWRVLDVHGP